MSPRSPRPEVYNSIVDVLIKLALQGLLNGIRLMLIFISCTGPAGEAVQPGAPAPAAKAEPALPFEQIVLTFEDIRCPCMPSQYLASKLKL